MPYIGGVCSCAGSSHFRVWQVGLIAWFRWLLSDGQVVFEASGVDEAADGVVREVTESQGDAT